MKLIHAADIHLDSPLRGLARYDGAPTEDLRGATRKAFVNLVDACLDARADALLLAGDLYDGEWQDFNTGLFFVKEMARLREGGVRVFLVHGNHDAASTITRKLKLPDNVTVFPHANPSTVEVPGLGLAVHGQSFGRRDVPEDLAAGYPPAVPGVLNVGLLHTALAGREGHALYAPTTSERLAAKGYAYWALGHVHRAETVSRSPWIVFPGNLQGRHARESGQKGFVVVSAEPEGVVSVESVPCDVVRWHDLEVDVGEARTLDHGLGLVRAELESVVEAASGRLAAVRVRLRGRGPVHGELVRDPETVEANVRSIATDVSGPVWVEKVLIETRPEVDLDSISTRGDAVGHLVRTLRGLPEDAEAVSALAAKLRPLLEKLPPDVAGLDRRLFDLAEPGELRGFLGEVERTLVPLMLDAEERP